MKQRSEKRKKIYRFLPLTSLIKRKLRTFHVVVLQQMQRNEQKHVMYGRSYCFAAQMRVSRFNKVNLSIYGAGRRLDEKSKQSVVSLRNVTTAHWDTKIREKQAKDQYLARKYQQILFIPWYKLHNWTKDVN